MCMYNDACTDRQTAGEEVKWAEVGAVSGQRRTGTKEVMEPSRYIIRGKAYVLSNVRRCFRHNLCNQP
jgi:hypothetical protein